MPRILCSPFRSLFGLLPLILALVAGAATAQEGYRIQPGDVLRVEVIEDNTLNRSVLVSPDGRISVPLAGTVQAGGRTIEAVQAALVSQLAPSFAAPPSVFVAIERLAPEELAAPAAPALPPAPPPVDAIYVLGEVNNPGRLEVEPGTTFLQLFALVGGPTRFAATGRVQLRRTENGAERIYVLDYDEIIAGRSPNGRATLAEGDIIVVPERRLFE